MTAEPELAGRGQKEWYDRLALEEDNVREALAYACESDDAERALMLSGSSWRFWHRRAQMIEGLQWYERAFAVEGEVSMQARARALYGMSEMERGRGNFDRSRDLLEQVIPMLRAAEENRWLVSAMNHLASAHLGAGDSATARRLYEETLGLARAEGQEHAISIVTGNLGYLALVEGRDEDAEALLTTARDLARVAGTPVSAAESLLNLALLSLRRGDVTGAARSIAESLRLFRSVGGGGGTFEVLLLAAVAIDRRADPHVSVRLHAAARALASERAYELSAGELELADASLSDLRATLDTETFAQEWALGEHLDLQTAVAIALQSLD